MVCNVPVSAKANGNRNQLGAWLDSGLIVEYTSHLVRVQLRNMCTIRNMKETPVLSNQLNKAAQRDKLRHCTLTMCLLSYQTFMSCSTLITFCIG